MSAMATERDGAIQAIRYQAQVVHQVVHRNVDGITHQESLLQPEPGGNCLNWVMGHIVFARQGWLTTVLGEAPLFDAATIARYKRGSSPLTDGSLALPFEELVAAYDRAQAPLVAAMARLTSERLAEKAPFSPGNDPSETVGSLVAKLCFHEGYHIGQTAILRRVLGRVGGIA